MLEVQTVPISFAGGLSSKTDALQVQLPNMLSLENAMFDKVGSLNKRPGYDILSNNTLQDGQIQSAVAVDSFNNEICLFDNDSVYTYIDAVDAWSNRGPAISLINTNYKIVDIASAQQLNPDCAYLEGIKVFVYEDSRGPCRYSVIDALTNAYIVSDAPLQNSLARPKVVTSAGKFYIFYTDNNNLYFQTINPFNPSFISTPSNVIADGYANFPYDVATNTLGTFSSNELIYIAYFKNDGNVILLDINPTFHDNIENITAVTSISTVEDQNNLSISIAANSNLSNWISWSTGQHVYTSLYRAIGFGNFFQILGPFLVDTVVSPIVTGIEGIGLGSLQIVYEIAGDISSNESVRSQIVSFISGVGSLSPVGTLYSVGLAAKPYKQGKEIYVSLAYQSQGVQYFPGGPITPLQNTYFTALLTQAPFTIVSKVLAGVGGGLRTNNMLSETVKVAPGVFLWANLDKDKLLVEDNTTFTLSGVNSTTIDYTDPNKFNSVTYSNNLLYVGGILSSYDGIQVVEQNFNVFPEDIFYQIIPGGGALSAGQYEYQVVYSWNDKFGQTQYSTPSPSIIITVPVNAAVLFTLPTLRLTSKTNVIIQVYRTQVNSPVLQLVTSNLIPLQNNTQVNSVVFLDQVADAEIVSNAPIYTTGGFLPNSAPPSCSLITLYNDRVIIGGLEDPNLLWYSKNKVDNSNANTIPVEFTALNTISVNQLGGPITGLGLMDGNLIIFKKNAIFIMNGDGTNDLGGGTPFPDPQLISQSVGCNNPGSIILTTTGIMFQSPNKGIWMLPRSLGEPVYIGAGVDTEAKEFLVSSANLDPNSNSVIFTTFDGPALIYDYFISQWSTWTNHNAVDAVIFNGAFSFVKENGSVYHQNQQNFYDGYVAGNQVPYSLEVTTPWIGVQKNLGYQSIFRFFILGQYKGLHQLNVAVAYDWNPTFTQTTSFAPNLTAGSNLWGGGANWGVPSPWGGIWYPYVFQVNCSRQKCSAISIKINDSQTAPYNEGFTLSNLMMEVGLFSAGLRIAKTNKASV